MYLEHFGLRESPFRITPHTEFFFAGANRGATLEALVYATTKDEGIVKVSGEVGSGKTMLCRMLLERLPPNVETVYLANPSLSRDELRHAIAEELQVNLPEGHAHTLVRALQDHLIQTHTQGKQVVIMIDEAHAMPSESLEEIRLLSNLETSRHKLLHIVLFGQPELDERLATTGMRQLKERITHNFSLEPLRRNDVGSYLMFRIRAAGYRGPDLFTPRAVQLLSQASEGLTRRINILADKALLSAFSDNKHHIDRKQVAAAVRDAQFKPMRDIRTRPGTWVFTGIAAVLVAIGAFLAGSYCSHQTPSSAPMAKELAPTAQETGRSRTEQVPREKAVTQLLASSVTPNEQPPAVSLDEQLSITEQWLKTVPDTHYFIQLLRTDGNNAKLVETFLKNEIKGLAPQQIHAYRSNLSGRDRFGVIYGDFPSAEAAQAELKRIQQNNPTADFYVRAFSKLR